MRCGVGKADLVVLSLHFDQHRARAAKQCNANRLVVDESARFAIAGKDAPEHEFAVRGDPLFREQSKGRMIGWRAKASRYDRLLGAVPDKGSVRACTKREA